MFIGKQPLARRMLEAVFKEPLEISAQHLAPDQLRCGSAGSPLLAVVNIYIARNFGESIWVNFKVFGITVAMLLFMLPQVLWLQRQDEGPGF